MNTERDSGTRIVLSWLREDAHENAERVLLRALDEVDTTPQRRSSWSAWRTNRMNLLARSLTTLAAIFGVAVIGYSVLPGLAIGGPGAAASSGPALIARGTFVTYRGAVELEASGVGTSATGRMTVSEEGGSFTVDLQCTRTTEDGLIMIGGRITSSTHGYAPVDTWAAIWLKRGSPAQAELWYLRGGHVIAYAPDCLAALDAQLEFELSVSDDPPDYNLYPIDGTVEFGP